MVFELTTGEQVAGITVKGVPVSVDEAAYSRRLIGWARVKGFDPTDLVVVDECGNLQWSRGPAYGYMVLVGFDDSLLVREFHGGDPVFYRFSIDGAVLAGPSKFGDSMPLALGADGVLYLARRVPCSYPCDYDNSLEVVAVSESLEVLDRIDVGPYSHKASAVLLDDGLMVVVRDGRTGIDFVRIQTASPGLARTAWPTIRRDNERTGWVAPW